MYLWRVSQYDGNDEHRSEEQTVSGGAGVAAWATWKQEQWNLRIDTEVYGTKIRRYASKT